MNRENLNTKFTPTSLKIPQLCFDVRLTNFYDKGSNLSINAASDQ